MKLAKLKVVQMRQELKDRGLDMTGNRPALMKRLREALQREERQQRQQRSVPPKPIAATVNPTDPPVGEQQPPNETAQPEIPVDEAPRLPSLPEAQPAPEEELIPDDKQPQETPTPAQPETTVDYEDEREREADVGGTQQNDSAVQKDQNESVVATGDMTRLKELAHEERMRKRRERFGAVQKPPSTNQRPPPVVKKPKESAEVEEMRKLNELKRRRALKFGSSFADTTISQEERERRLKRQRRFQSAGNGTAV